MNSLETIIVTNATASGISIEENLEIAKSNQFIKWPMDSRLADNQEQSSEVDESHNFDSNAA